MEVRRQEKEMGRPLVYNHPPPKRDSSKVAADSAAGERLRDRNTVISDGDAVINTYRHQINKPGRDLEEPDTDPAPARAANRSSSLKYPGPTPPLPPPEPASASLVRYRECLKNHAVTMGGHVLDGCGEFMPSGEEGTLEALKCAACGCHRNFHRKEINGETQHMPNNNHSSFSPNRNSTRRESIPSLPQHRLPSHGHGFPSRTPPTASNAPIMMTFGGGSGGGPGELSREDLLVYQNAAGQSSAQSKKRFRTKFNQEQKDKMMEFAEKLGWKIQKQDEEELQQFCAQTGVKRQVFKVWMHNNKQAMKKKQTVSN